MLSARAALGLSLPPAPFAALARPQTALLPGDIDRGYFLSLVGVQFLLVFFFLASDDTGNRLRFQLELEFVQCLANPNYLNCEY